MRIKTIIQLIAITDVMKTSSISNSAVPTTAGTTILVMVDVTRTLLEGVASTLAVIETTLDVVKCVWVSKRCVPISGTLLTGGVTADSELVTSAVLLYSDCDDDGTSVSGGTVEQCMGITVLLEPQHIGSPLVQLVQSLLLSNEIMMVLISDGSRASGLFT